MATNFFQRWSSRSLTAKDKASTTLSETNEAVEELTESKQFSEPVYDANAEINQAVTLDKVTNDAVDKQSDISDKSSDDVLTIADADSVTFDSGVVSFLKQGVDKSVKKAALAKLFHSDEFNYISDMDDHTEDFSNIPKLDDSIAKQLRGWVNAVLEEPEQEMDLVQDTARVQEEGQVEALCIERVEEVKFSAVEDETVEPVTEDFKLSQGCDDPRHKTIQQGET
ncbi:DUF3306 domain-containing protein [Moritella viscosa]|uniref:DUF3306 domain-containing protein n=1 Tax=Moritella viscosa TaxID=80854 RepID=A0A1L0ADH2_9GAMM|nr:DUF3306 domain-containing protein [Moritella viscosa]SGY84707.1 Putative uncharacterized protein [Moritella viscosa]SHN97695.1 Putative uncharacterized protein [Moritella viscosa]SHN97696.1 Putative uncharacterized protein [Moritella viscosa]SHN98286.1 Putative uncharacterized protein [Moritella viscosa]SHN98998.1 Putative uncharacterized protein [Moritella viscosa]